MIYGICITIGVIMIIASRFLYCLYDITLGGDSNNNLKGWTALFIDILGTVLVIYSLYNTL
jgi:hypothetical protein